MVTCSFCGKTIDRGTGKMYIKKEGKVFYFCSNKCEKNTIKLGRKPRTTRWTAEFAKIKKTALATKAEKSAKTE